MNKVSLISTTHAEKGLANIKELFLLLDRIKPDAIFMELPADIHDSYFSLFSLKSVESEAVNIFKQGSKVDIFSVDLPLPEVDARNRYSKLIDILYDSSESLRSMKNQIDIFSAQYGYPYLNSDKHLEHIEALKSEKSIVVEGINDSGLSALYEEWLNVQDRREKEMLSNIDKHCSRGVYDRAVFLIGSAHVNPIKELASRIELGISVQGIIPLIEELKKNINA